MNKTLEERITDLERRLLPIATFLYERYGKEIETIKLEDINQNGELYKIKYTIETDKGTKDIVIEVKGYSDKQAMFIGNRDIIYPQMSRLHSDGKISWFKTINKQLLNK
jgi:hypothetical protein